jgi:hypothetical protein
MLRDGLSDGDASIGAHDLQRVGVAVADFDKGGSVFAVMNSIVDKHAALEQIAAQSGRGISANFRWPGPYCS